MLSTIHFACFTPSSLFLTVVKVPKKNNFAPVKGLFYTLNDRFHAPDITFKRSYCLFTAI